MEEKLNEKLLKEISELTKTSIQAVFTECNLTIDEVIKVTKNVVELSVYFYKDEQKRNNCFKEIEKSNTFSDAVLTFPSKDKKTHRALCKFSELEGYKDIKIVKTGSSDTYDGFFINMKYKIVKFD